jgi:TP901 family phage tail tape measure protein
MKATATPSEDLRKKFEKNETQIAETTAKLEDHQRQLESTAEELKKAGINTDDLTGETKKLGEQYEKLKDQQKQFTELNSKIQENKQQISELKGELTKATAVAAGAATAFYKVFVTPSANFEEQMSTVKAISGATAGEMEQLTALAKEMGSTTKFTAVEAGEALEYMAMAGWDSTDMMNGLAGVMNLAAASGEDLGTVSDIVTDAMTAFGMGADESQRFADVLAATATSANTDVGTMGETFQQTAALAGAMGYTIEDMSVAIGLMANAGIKGSKSGTSLKNIITNLADPTDDVAAAMEALGVSLVNTDGTAKSFEEVMGGLREGFSGLTEAEKAAYASTIAGKQGMAGLLSLVNASAEDYDKLYESINDCSGAAEEMANTRLDNLNGDITLMKSAWEGLATTVGDLFNGTLRDTVQSLTDVIGKVNEWVQANPETAATIVKVVGALLALNVGIKAVQLAYTVMKGKVLAAKAAMLAFKTAGGLVGIATTAWTSICSVATGVTTALGAAFTFLTSPIGLIVVAIAALIAAVVLVVKHWDKVKEVALSVWEAIKSAWGAAAEWFGALWEKIKAPFVAAAEWFNTTVVQPIITIFGPIVEKIGEIFSTLWQIVTALFSVAASWFNDNVIQPVISVFSGIVESVGGFFSALWQRITEIFSAVASWFGERFAEAWAAIKAVFAPVAAFFAGIWQTIKEQFSKIGTAIGDAIGNAFKSVVNAILTFAENKINGFINAINTVVGVVNKIPGVSISTITPLSIPKLATGSANTPETFIAGEAGAELITNAKNRTVYTAAQTGQLMEASATMISILPLLQAAIEAAKVRQSVPTVGGRPEESDTPTVTAAGEKQTSVVINSAPVFHVGSDAQAQDIEELLRKHDEALLDEVEERQRQREDDERRRNYD